MEGKLNKLGQVSGGTRWCVLLKFEMGRRKLAKLFRIWERFYEEENFTELKSRMVKYPPGYGSVTL